ncbi:unnamed protein product [Phytophthora fragariaefolia]|uniref:Unnamed protein product n=1 Tax=Phytophthora fragariaefolia TaxID=1490495 RepID=A0A9W6Y2K2_9STRA|nr:unnamed protein product [Phytophthora fragariaefolia]
MPQRRVIRRDSESFLQRLEGRVGAERDRLVREHQEYIDGTCDRDAAFDELEENDDAHSTPAPPDRRPRMAVLPLESPTRNYQRKGALVIFYDKLAKSPRLHGKAPVAAFYVEELAELAANVESEGDQDDEDDNYVDDAEEMANDDAQYESAISPPVTPRRKTDEKAKGGAVLPKQAAQATRSQQLRGKGEKVMREAKKRRRIHITNVDNTSRYVICARRSLIGVRINCL